MNNDRINNAQRKALVGVVTEVMERKIQEAKDASGQLIEEITENVKVELGIDTIDNQIKAMDPIKYIGCYFSLIIKTSG